jgi:hypothetical protein
MTAYICDGCIAAYHRRENQIKKSIAIASTVAFVILLPLAIILHWSGTAFLALGTGWILCGIIPASLIYENRQIKDKNKLVQNLITRLWQRWKRQLRCEVCGEPSAYMIVLEERGNIVGYRCDTHKEIAGSGGFSLRKA